MLVHLADALNRLLDGLAVANDRDVRTVAEPGRASTQSVGVVARDERGGAPRPVGIDGNPAVSHDSPRREPPRPAEPRGEGARRKDCRVFDWRPSQSPLAHTFATVSATQPGLRLCLCSFGRQCPSRLRAVLAYAQASFGSPAVWGASNRQGHDPVELQGIEPWSSNRPTEPRSHAYPALRQLAAFDAWGQAPPPPSDLGLSTTENPAIARRVHTDALLELLARRRWSVALSRSQGCVVVCSHGLPVGRIGQAPLACSVQSFDPSRNQSAPKFSHRQGRGSLDPWRSQQRVSLGHRDTSFVQGHPLRPQGEVSKRRRKSPARIPRSPRTEGEGTRSGNAGPRKLQRSSSPPFGLLSRKCGRGTITMPKTISPTSQPTGSAMIASGGIVAPLAVLHHVDARTPALQVLPPRLEDVATRFDRIRKRANGGSDRNGARNQGDCLKHARPPMSERMRRIEAPGTTH